MKRNPYPGKFIVFEGLDGSGNTTQAALLSDNLKNLGQKVALTKEPTNNMIGGLIRSWLTGDWESSPECFQLLFTADRAHHLTKEIIPLLKKGVHVISDRYAFSTMAFGGIDIKDKEWLAVLNKPFIAPDLTFVIKARPQVAMGRIKKHRHSTEYFEKEKKQQVVWKNYLALTKKFPHMHIIDGERQIHEIAEEVFTLTRKKFSM